MSSNVLVTGAYGRVGSAVIDNLADREEYDFTYLDRRDHPTRETVVADVADLAALESVFEGHDAVVHLAAALSDDDWDNQLRSNVVGAYNVFEAARRTDVERVVFASSNHVVGTYQAEHAPKLYHPDYDIELDRTTRPKPRSIYGVCKLFGEGLGQYYVDHHAAPTRCYALRICGVRSAEHDHPYGDAERGVADGRFERGSTAYWEQAAKRMAMGTTRRDFAHAVECCLEDETVSFDVFFVTSDNDASWLDIEHTKAVLGYEPQDDLGDWDGELPDDVPPDAPSWMPR
jgi:nucleoside-diphosphate-sugar epimerase